MRECSEIGQFLVAKREEMGITQVEMAAHLGIEPIFLSAVENKVMRVDANFVLRLMQLSFWSNDDKWILTGIYWSLL